jgi:hypothetical protein
MNLRLRQVWRRDRNGHSQDASDGDPWGRAAEEPFFRAASGVSGRAAGTRCIRNALIRSVEEMERSYRTCAASAEQCKMRSGVPISIFGGA